MVFFCVSVFDSDGMDDRSSKYWAQDTSLECYTPDHLKLVVLALVFLAVFSFGFPIISAIVLRNSQRAGRLTEPGAMFEIIGFLYRGYDHRFSYWESIVMLRKACLSLIAVFSFPYGGTSQGLLASFVLVMCLFLHTMARPYRDEFACVNNYESYSLIISCTTFLLSCFFVPGRAGETTKILLSFYLIGGIALLLGFLSLNIFLNIVEYCKEDLNIVNYRAFDPESVLSTLSTWILYRFGFIGQTDDSDDAENKV